MTRRGCCDRSKGRRAWTRGLIGFAALAIVASACTSEGGSAARASSGATKHQSGQHQSGQQETGQQGSASTPSSDLYSPKAPLAWESCSEVPNGQCATLVVPLDWAKPDGETIHLRLGRIRSAGDSQGSVIINPGGPGASGLDLLRNNPMSSQIIDQFDTVSWDPRGVGASTAVECEAAVPAMLSLDPDPDSAAEQSALDRAAEKVSSDCARNNSELLGHVSTNDVARDLEAIRVALKEDRINYVGFSYGTHIGQVYAEMYPNRIRTMVLDGVVDPSQGFEEFLLGQTKAFDAAFRQNAKACRSAGRKRCGVRDLGSAYDEVHGEVEREPLGSGDTEVGPAELATAAIMASYWTDGWTRLGPALAKALDDQPRDLRQLADIYTDLAGYAAYAAVVCTDSAPPQGDSSYEQFADELREVSPRLGGAIANELLPCATWPAKAKSKPTKIVAQGAPPILVVGNTGDPATPYSNAVTVADTLASGVLVTADIAGHTAYGTNRCVTKVVDNYILDLVVPTKDPDCN